MELRPGTTSLIVIQPTPFCNIDCSYCYLSHRSDKTKLESVELRGILEKVLAFPTLGDEITIVWHAGEPLVLGVDYYSKAFEVANAARPAHLKVTHAFQTNGTLITDRWCELFREWNVAIGLSLDGPRDIHDTHRRTRAGKGTFDAAMKGLASLRRNGVPFYVISVLTEVAIAQPEKMFQFYKEHEITDVGFNVEEQEGIHRASTLAGVAEHHFVTFLEQFCALMERERFAIAVRELEETMRAIQGADRGAPTSNQNVPFGIVSIDVRGDVYTFSPELVGYGGAEYPTFAVGNLRRDSFAELSRSPVLGRMTQMIDAGIEMCRRRCGYFPICGGGAPSNKLFENGTFASDETRYCRLSKMRVADFVLATVENRLGRQ